MPTEKQKKAAKLYLENNGNGSKAMRDAGYSEATAKNPHLLKNSDGFKQLMEEYLPDQTLQEVHAQGLLATKQVIGKNKFGEDEILRETPDHGTRFKYLELAYKLKGKLQPEAQGNTYNMNINVLEAIQKSYKPDYTINE